MNMEKTFREVIRDIKEGEVWERNIISGNIKIKLEDDFIMIWKDDELVFTFGNKYKFKTNKEEYTFEEAFKAYEEGKEIESVASNHCYKRIKGDHFYKENTERAYRLETDNFLIDEIRGKWYIEGK